METSSHLPVPLFPAEDATSLCIVLLPVAPSPTVFLLTRGPLHQTPAHKVTGLPPSPPRPLLQTSLLGEDQPECSGCPCLSPHHSEQISSFPTAGPAPEPVVCVSGEAGAVNLHRDPLTPPGLERVRGWQPRSLCCGDIPAFSTAEVELQWAKQIKVVLCWYKRT